MYDTLWQLISSGDFSLTDAVSKIDVLWVEGQLTDAERTKLKELALENISTDQEKPEMEATVAALVARVDTLEEAIAALQSGAGDTDNGGASGTTYEEWTAWDGYSDKYQYGAVVSHNGKLYISIYKDGQNVWEPGALGTESLWEEYEESEA